MYDPRFPLSTDGGIDWSDGSLNVDHQTGIHYGVIPAADVGQVWWDNVEPVYGPPTCPRCGSENLVPYDLTAGRESLRPEEDNMRCRRCGIISLQECCAPEDPIAWVFQGEQYVLHQSQGSPDIFVLRSPYLTFGRYCSPCAPGAVYLKDYHRFGAPAFCLDPSWFDGGVAPYGVWRIDDHTLVQPAPTGEED
jgi:hypothetical protein